MITWNPANIAYEAKTSNTYLINTETSALNCSVRQLTHFQAIPVYFCNWPSKHAKKHNRHYLPILFPLMLEDMSKMIGKQGKSSTTAVSFSDRASCKIQLNTVGTA
ncbi:hypothetical protein chiPu_0002289 [Chiloscyllium punctatum]|uniref:Uncharacterized protein n=1 Tax=Chiloscyllium punctatum TaxID=137246 RepID=A0A401S0E8_CHIPU|nr:hypothetical protein [Chiloscyllium punctatum]